MTRPDEDIVIQAEARRIRDRLSAVARPDSRFDRDFSSFIPDFEGSVQASIHVTGLESFAATETVFCTLETGLWHARQACLRAGKQLVVPTFGLRRGLVLLSPEAIPEAEFALATCLDGMEYLGRPIELGTCFARPAELFLCGASAICRNGTRFGIGTGYIDCEWWIGRTLGLVSEKAETVAIVHSCQISEANFPAGSDLLGIDRISTPEALIATGSRHRPDRWPDLGFDPSLAEQDLIRLARENAAKTVPDRDRSVDNE